MERFSRNEGGAAAVEFSLIAPIVALTLIGVATGGGLILAYNKMRQAVHSGAEYVMTIGGEDAAAVRDVVLMAWADRPEGAAVTVTKACVCGTTAHNCTTNCDDGDYPEKALTISATQNYSGLSGLSRTISASQVVRTW